MLREGLSYRRDAFAEGLRVLGYQLESRCPRDPKPGDVLVLWNRNRGFESTAEQWERAGATLVIAENGYVPRHEKQFALSLSRHNGAGWTPIGEAPRFEIPMKPWRQDGEHILILPQRGIGSPGVAMPQRWERLTVAKLAKLTKRPVRVRRHPGQRDARPLEADLDGVWLAITWGSGAGVKALFHGVPVLHDFPEWIARSGALPFHPDSIEVPWTGDRTELQRNISWAQWGLSEIASGRAFEALLR